VKIASIETLRRDDSLALVRIRTDDGLEGIGQTSPYLSGLSSSVLHELVAPYFLGKDPWNIEALVDDFVRLNYKFYGTLLFRALCGVDTAIWDMLGQATGRPVYQLLGGAVRTTLPVYGSSMIRSITPQDEGERMAALAGRDGFRCFKIRVGEAMGRDVDAWPGRTEEIIPAVRKAVGDGVDLHADANGGFSVERAIRVGRLLEDNGYFHFEEPCPFPEIESTARVAAALDIAVAGGEQDNSLEQFNRMIGMRAVDIVQPDIGYIGGIARARRVALMAEAAGIACTPHCANQSLLQVFTLHLAAASPSARQYQEWSIEDVPWVHGVYEPVPEVLDGSVTLGEGPGWGVSIDPAFERAAESRISR
jgi:L-alanine-DL-glutamate epimerase-like enolase superfamily enzyme